mgnify:CR=1 FL=1
MCERERETHSEGCDIYVHMRVCVCPYRLVSRLHIHKFAGHLCVCRDLHRQIEPFPSALPRIVAIKSSPRSISQLFSSIFLMTTSMRSDSHAISLGNAAIYIVWLCGVGFPDNTLAPLCGFSIIVVCRSVPKLLSIFDYLPPHGHPFPTFDKYESRVIALFLISC